MAMTLVILEKSVGGTEFTKVLAGLVDEREGSQDFCFIKLS